MTLEQLAMVLGFISLVLFVCTVVGFVSWLFNELLP